MIEFREFGKIPRLHRECVITEKIDGTNASIFIGEDGEFLTGSRQRWITPEDDNFGFSRWAHDHKEELLDLGPGHHFGEWWGKGIQRNYGLDERRFSLFNTGRWVDPKTCEHVIDPTVDLRAFTPICCYVVPVLYRGVFSTERVEGTLQELRDVGSYAAPEFHSPEGIVVYHAGANQYFKQTCEHDDEPKNAHAKKERVSKPPRTTGIMWTGGRRQGATPGYAGVERRRNDAT